MIYPLITQLIGKASVARMCRVLEVSRSGYYAACHALARAQREDAQSAQVKQAFEASGRSYGSRRMSVALRACGIDAGRHRAATLMKANQLRPVWRRSFIHTTNSNHDLPRAANLLQRQFNPSQANTAWASDLTYIPTRTGWLYLAAVMDLYSRKIVGWSMSSSMPAELVCRALNMAIASRKPLAGLLVHSDQGTQYASAEYAHLVAKHQLIASMSKKGNCWDNAVMERFFLNLKRERVWQRDYANHGEASRDVADYIVSFYNGERLHSSLGYVSPTDYEVARGLTSTSSLEKVSEKS